MKKDCVIVVTTYEHFLTKEEVGSLVQMKNILGGHYDICIAGPEGLRRKIYEKLFDNNISFKLFKPDFFKSWEAYSELPVTREFYEAFTDYKYMLIYQTDAWVFRNELDYWIKKDYDYIGAPFFWPNLILLDKMVGNGGFCLRKIDSMIAYIDKYGYKLKESKFYDDNFFARNFDDFLKIPLKKEAAFFSFDEQPDNLFTNLTERQLPFGCHKPLKNNYDFWKKYIDFSVKIQDNNMKVLLCTIAKNENKYIKEFVDWYKELGFTNICLFDNNDKDGEHFEDVIGEEIKSGFVILKDYRGRKICQFDAYEECYYTYNSQYDWIAFFDADEFLELDKKSFRNVGEYLSLPQFQKYDVIHINWHSFGDNGKLRYENKPLRERFPEPLPIDKPIAYTFSENRHIKSIIKGGLKGIFWASNPHTVYPASLRCCNNIGVECNVESPFCDVNYQYAKLNHYSTKSTEEYCNKMKRGFPDQIVDKERVKYLLSERYFRTNDVTKEKIDLIKELLDIDMSGLLLEYRGERSKDVKIYTLCYDKKNFDFIDNKYIQPLQVGADVNKKDVCKLKDNTGVNISKNNFFYVECTGTYWIWKNVHNCKYKGQMQYRRPLEGVNEDMNFDEIFDKYDVITCKPFNHPENSKPTAEQPMFIPANTVAEGYAFSNCKDDLDILEIAIKTKYPEYTEDYDKYINRGENLYYSNGFIMREKDFDEYCMFLFNCLNEYLKLSRINSEEDLYKHVKYNLSTGKYIRYQTTNIPDAAINWQTKIGGFLSERIWTLWVQHKFPRERILELPYKKMEEQMYT